jgi:hypothetical protein
MPLRLVGEANLWWTAQKRSITGELGPNVPIPWDWFKQEFNERYFPRAQRQQCSKDCQNLTQGNMIVLQYSTEFLKLSRFASHLIPYEQTKAEKFCDGLIPHIREKIAILGIKDYFQMVHTANIAEKGIKEAAADYVQKKRSMSQRAYPSKRQAVETSSGAIMKKGASMNQGSQQPLCTKCRKHHFREFKVGTSVCFWCGKPSHFIRDLLEGIRSHRERIISKGSLFKLEFMHSLLRALMLRRAMQMLSQVSFLYLAAWHVPYLIWVSFIHLIHSCQIA